MPKIAKLLNWYALMQCCGTETYFVPVPTLEKFRFQIQIRIRFQTIFSSKIFSNTKSCLYNFTAQAALLLIFFIFWLFWLLTLHFSSDPDLNPDLYPNPNPDPEPDRVPAPLRQKSFRSLRHQLWFHNTGDMFCESLFISIEKKYQLVPTLFELPLRTCCNLQTMSKLP